MTIVSVSLRAVLLLSSLCPVFLVAVLDLILDCLFNVRLVRPFAQWCQIGVVPFWHWQTHGCEHCILLGFLQLALFLLDARSLGLFRFSVAFRVPGEVFVLLPAPDWRHERVAQIVFALRIVLDVFPLELGAAAAVDMLALQYDLYKVMTYRLPSLRTVCSRSMAVKCGVSE